VAGAPDCGNVVARNVWKSAFLPLPVTVQRENGAEMMRDKSASQTRIIRLKNGLYGREGVAPVARQRDHAHHVGLNHRAPNYILAGLGR